MRAKSRIYHIECFRCTACERQLEPGDEFALREDRLLYCKIDHDQIELLKAETTSMFHSNLKAQKLGSEMCNIQNKSSSSDCGSVSGKTLNFLMRFFVLNI